MADLLSVIEGLKDDDSIWVENLLPSDSVYRSNKTKDKYEMAGNGLVGSVVSVPVKIAKESYLRRAVARGVLRALTPEEAAARNDELVFDVDDASEPNRMLESLEKGASEVGARYKKKNLTDDGTESKSVTAKQVWEGKTKAKKASTVRRSEIKAPAIPLDEVPDGPIEAVITEPVKEGEWLSDTGLD